MASYHYEYSRGTGARAYAERVDSRYSCRQSSDDRRRPNGPRAQPSGARAQRREDSFDSGSNKIFEAVYRQARENGYSVDESIERSNAAVGEYKMRQAKKADEGKGDDFKRVWKDTFREARSRGLSGDQAADDADRVARIYKEFGKGKSSYDDLNNGFANMNFADEPKPRQHSSRKYSGYEQRYDFCDEPRSYSYSSRRPPPPRYDEGCYYGDSYSSRDRRYPTDDVPKSKPSHERPSRDTTAKPKINLYKLLGVSKSATPDMLKKAHRKLSMQHHPDRAKPADKEKANAKMAEINQAYDVLSVEKLRKEYDSTGKIPSNL
jgi:hypothetical protein